MNYNQQQPIYVNDNSAIYLIILLCICWYCFCYCLQSLGLSMFAMGKSMEPTKPEDEVYWDPVRRKAVYR